MFVDRSHAFGASRCKFEAHTSTTAEQIKNITVLKVKPVNYDIKQAPSKAKTIRLKPSPRMI